MADATDHPARRDELLTFVVVGGGYAGLEALAEVQDFAADAIEQYPAARLHGMRWMLVEATDRVLPEIDASLADYAIRELRSRGIDVRLGTTLEELTATCVRLATGEVLPTRTVVWTAGVTAHPSIRNLGLPTDVRGRIVVDRYLRAHGEDDVWALGDCAAVPDPRKDVEFCPPTSQHAVRQGSTAGRNVAASLGVGHGRAVHLQVDGPVREPRALQGGREGVPPPAARLPGVVAGAHVPPHPDSRNSRARCAPSSTGPSGLPFQRDIAEVGTIGQPRPLRADAYERAGTHRA